MKPNKLLIGICISILLVLTIVNAKPSTNYETSATGRIVGNNPDDMIRQLRNEEIDLEHATYSEHTSIKNLDSKVREFIEMGLSKLKKVFGSDVIDDFVRHSDEAIENMKRIDLSLGVNKIDIDSTTFKQLATQQQLEIVEQIGKCENVFELPKTVKQVEIVDELIDPSTGKKISAAFDSSTNIIKIAKNADFNDVKSFLIKHEYAHAKVFGEIGIITEDEIFEYFDEFLADNLAKKEFGGEYILKKLTTGEVLNGAGDDVARYLALAKKYDPSRYNSMVSLIKQRNGGDRIIHLSETFLKNSDITKLKGNGAVMDDISKEIKEVIENCIG